MAATNTHIRALSVRRPWANLIISGRKTIENRTWTTKYRGELVVHAGTTFDQNGSAAAAWRNIPGYNTAAKCPTGYLGIVCLADVHPAGGVCCAPWGEDHPDIYHWVLRDPQPFPRPIPGKGRLGLYWAPEQALNTSKRDKKGTAT